MKNCLTVSDPGLESGRRFRTFILIHSEAFCCSRCCSAKELEFFELINWHQQFYTGVRPLLCSFSEMILVQAEMFWFVTSVQKMLRCFFMFFLLGRFFSWTSLFSQLILNLRSSEAITTFPIFFCLYYDLLDQSSLCSWTHSGPLLPLSIVSGINASAPKYFLNVWIILMKKKCKNEN